MAEEKVVTQKEEEFKIEDLGNEILGGNWIQAGSKLTEALENTGLPVSSSFWNFDSVPETWTLYIATPRVEKEGPADVYDRIAETLREEKLKGFHLRNIMVVSPKDERVRLLRVFLKRRGKGSPLRIQRTTIGGVYFEDAHVYRSK